MIQDDPDDRTVAEGSAFSPGGTPMHQGRRSWRSFCLAVGLMAALAGPSKATCGGGGGGGTGGLNSGGGTAEPRIYQVPWLVLRGAQMAPAESQLVLYWFPTSPEEARASGLQNSRSLTLASARCVGMALVPNDHKPLYEKYGAQGASGVLGSTKGVQLVVLAQADGAELARLAGASITLGAVEKMVQAELRRRDDLADQRLDAATSQEKSGQAEAAIGAYESLYASRCLSPGPGKKAAKALKRLGREVSEFSAPTAIDEPGVAERVLRALLDGLAAENAGDYLAARGGYAAAHAADPGDPVPLRFLGEVERHHTGDWAAASRWFAEILARPVDPMTRAVAEHGLGKMTIHADRFAEGLALIERSTKTYPLPLAYRNLAVYWNSEGQMEKARGYAEQAMALAPEDPYNTVFLAVFLAEDGRREEALRIARQHEDLLEASYNLAVIHVLAGDAATGLALLKRHFFEYERYDAVRAKEMKEAREDIGFLDLRQDASFVELTRLATDPKLGWKG
jgi:tetratricopeptide (TPR) repeat protein